MRLGIIIAIGLIGALAAPAHAQWTNPSTGRTFNNPISSSMDLYIQQSMQRKQLQAMLERKRAGKPAKAKTPDKGGPKHAPVNATDFKKGNGRPTVDAFLAASNLDPAVEAQLRLVIDATFVALEKELRPNSVASAMGFVLGTAMQITTGVEIPDADARELVIGVNDLLGASADFKKLKAPERQALYDGLVTAGALLIIMNAAGENDPALKAQAQETAKGLLKTLAGVGGASPAPAPAPANPYP